MSGCSHNCGSCSPEDKASCGSQDFSVLPNEMTSIKKIIGVVSGKGGVGKSMVTSLLAVTMSRRNHRTAILDADVTGPSIPKIFGVSGNPVGTKYGIHPMKSKYGVEIMSTNLLLENETDPVVWRGPVIANMVKQFWSEVIWAEEDFMFIDMPPGTGDVPLTVFQSIPVDGIIIVTSPQELVSMIVEKAVKMADAMNIPILGMVENMSYFECPDCGNKYNIFGESKADEIAKKLNIPMVAKIPMNMSLSAASDKGEIEEFEGDWLNEMADALEKTLEE
ncbi:MAG: Mrp/NBP35 family ATP-binding protein [Firmicutes bacterium]|nr:Mrp/NBP35 family ATP-binding protein [Bacillota bacterium]MBR2593378.1 Mrp/NBP35 family ATP-binding protein [Bacillota bacterium]